MKGGFTLAILETIGDVVTNSGDLFESILSAGYGASLGKMEYELHKAKSSRVKKKMDIAEKKRLRKRYYTMIWNLKKDGLLSSDIHGFFKITSRGKQKLAALQKRSVDQLPFPMYQESVSGNIIIVIFDIPERERRKRSWLRLVLKNLGLKMIQKSVWIGKAKVPREFLDDIKNLNLIDCVEIFEVGKTGTLSHLA
ncbi:MAG: CRISPR-associated endonuclease Cas2 [Candidatus Ryanbacteria bacterium RIFCSPLOWO2_01_FULL_48_26]|uniref:CRISPR-associated endonuclease Cas2 n=1 Tax=Candidatus Ryanbacteria bacterium RIFCSPLOWO2_01_FULL_48_26 TaxID=1802126 RepID=A0A1G2GSP5_9BACT|nr:MAG: CRISPR-associated endonuclease Cas2 [Candidatus Ryanbacteria bacterium RIFCSPLOWO2_01_FULL_48_26]